MGRFQKEASRRTNMNLVLVSHGLTLRVFLMRWYKWTVDQFQLLHNFGNADFLVMELGPGGRSVSLNLPTGLVFVGSFPRLSEE